jgi:hypothetical protein
VSLAMNQHDQRFAFARDSCFDEVRCNVE